MTDVETRADAKNTCELEPPNEQICRLGFAKFYAERQVLEIAGRDRRLEPKLAAVLELLIAADGRPVTRQDLLDRIWGPAGSDEALTQAVSRLRRILRSASPDGMEVIVTVPRGGYRLDVAPLPSTDGPTARPFGRRRGQALRWLVALPSNSHVQGFVAGAVCVTIAILIWRALSGPMTIEMETFLIDPQVSTQNGGAGGD